MCTCKRVLVGMSVFTTLVLGLFPFIGVPAAWHLGEVVSIPGVWFIGKVMAVLIPIGIYGGLGRLWHGIIASLQGPCPTAEQAES